MFAIATAFLVLLLCNANKLLLHYDLMLVSTLNISSYLKSSIILSFNKCFQLVDLFPKCNKIYICENVYIILCLKKVFPEILFCRWHLCQEISVYFSIELLQLKKNHHVLQNIIVKLLALNCEEKQILQNRAFKIHFLPGKRNIICNVRYDLDYITSNVNIIILIICSLYD